MQPRMILMALALFAGLIINACTTTQVSTDTAALDGTNWFLSALYNHSLLPERDVTMHFEQGRVYGIDGCNRYSASYTAADARLKVGEEMVTTKMACPAPVMQQAAAFMHVLSEAQRYRREGQRLFLLNAEGSALAVFTVQSSELGGTSWLVTGYNNGKQAVVSVVAGAELTAVFHSDGRLSGSSGCNTYTATYETSNNRIKIGAVAATFKICDHPDGVMEQEAQYLRALTTAATYRLEGNRLELRIAEGALAALLTARAAESP